MKRRDFVKTVALSGMAVAASDLVGDLIAQTPQGKVLESKFKGLADIALARGEDAGLQLRRHPLHAQRPTAASNATGGNREFDDAGGGFGGGGGGGRRRARRRRRRGRRRVRRRRRGGAGRDAARRASASASSTAASGASRAARSSPRTRSGASRASRPRSRRPARSPRARTSSSRRCRPTPSTGSTPMKKDPRTVSQDEKQAYVQKIVDAVVKTKDVTNVNVSVQLEHEWKYFASQRRLLHRAGDLHDDRRRSRVTARKDGETRTRNFTRRGR